MFLTVRVHPFPFRTRQLSSPVPKILAWQRAGKIGQCQHKRFGESQTFWFASLAQSVEHAAVNRGVVGSSPTRGAKMRWCRHGRPWRHHCYYFFFVPVWKEVSEANQKFLCLLFLVNSVPAWKEVSEANQKFLCLLFLVDSVPAWKEVSEANWKFLCLLFLVNSVPAWKEVSEANWKFLCLLSFQRK